MTGVIETQKNSGCGKSWSDNKMRKLLSRSGNTCGERQSYRFRSMTYRQERYGKVNSVSLRRVFGLKHLLSISINAAWPAQSIQHFLVLISDFQHFWFSCCQNRLVFPTFPVFITATLSLLWVFTKINQNSVVEGTWYNVFPNIGFNVIMR